MLCHENQLKFSSFLESEMVDHLSQVYAKDAIIIIKTAKFVSKAVDIGYVAILNDMDKKLNRKDFGDIIDTISDEEDVFDSGHEAYYASKDKMYSRMREETNVNPYSTFGLQEGSPV